MLIGSLGHPSEQQFSEYLQMLAINKEGQVFQISFNASGMKSVKRQKFMLTVMAGQLSSMGKKVADHLGLQRHHDYSLV